MFEIYAKHTVKKKVGCDTPEQAVLLFRQNFPEYNIYVVEDGENQLEVFRCECGNPILTRVGELPKGRCSECIETVKKIENESDNIM